MTPWRNGRGAVAWLPESAEAARVCRPRPISRRRCAREMSGCSPSRCPACLPASPTRGVVPMPQSAAPRLKHVPTLERPDEPPRSVHFYAYATSAYRPSVERLGIQHSSSPPPLSGTQLLAPSRFSRASRALLRSSPPLPRRQTVIPISFPALSQNKPDPRSGRLVSILGLVSTRSEPRRVSAWNPQRRPDPATLPRCTTMAKRFLRPTRSSRSPRFGPLRRRRMAV
jgi:hypothetical protein